MARFLGLRSLAWSKLASFFRCGLPRNTTSDRPMYPLAAQAGKA